MVYHGSTWFNMVYHGYHGLSIFNIALMNLEHVALQ